MVLSELLQMLKRTGVPATEAQIRFAIKTGKISRPPVNGSLNFVFTDEIVAEIVAYFTDRKTSKREPAQCA